MGCLISSLLIASIGVLVIFDILFWSVSWIMGLIGILTIIAFIIAYSVYEDLSLSHRDFRRYSYWGIFCKKIGWAWGVALMVYASAFVLTFLILGA